MTVHRAIATYASASPAVTDEAALLEKYQALVERIARRLVWRTGMQSAYDDLWSAGALALIEAARRYDPAKGATFATFAEHRVRGAMLDELRSMDHLPRRLRNRTDDMAKAKRKLEEELGREATVDEIAKELDLDIDEVAGIAQLMEPHARDRGVARTAAHGSRASLRRGSHLPRDRASSPGERASRLSAARRRS
jgi:RNA polymerase sigma factor for flagellar operon FliA